MKSEGRGPLLGKLRMWSRSDAHLANRGASCEVNFRYAWTTWAKGRGEPLKNADKEAIASTVGAKGAETASPKCGDTFR